MTENKEPTPREVYGDIIDLPAWEPKPKHPRMSLEKRAAQFMPFAALSGFDDILAEKFRRTEPEKILSEDQYELLDRQMKLVTRAVAEGEHPVLTFVHFIPDPSKPGGKHETVTAPVLGIDRNTKKILLDRGDNPEIPESIRFDRVVSIEGDLADQAEEW